jgi:hypothetical protein
MVRDERGRCDARGGFCGGKSFGGSGSLAGSVKLGRVGRNQFLDLDGAAGRGDVRALRAERGVDEDLAGDPGVAVADAETFGVGRGELEAVEEDGGATVLDEAQSKPANDFGESDLDGFPVFERRERDPVAEGFTGLTGDVIPEAGVGSVEAGVEVAEDVLFEGDGAALQAVGFDVTTEVDLHGYSFGPPPPPGWGGANWLWILSISEMNPAKYKNP